MTEYRPDEWIVIRIEGGEGGPLDKVMGGWRGGFAGADSWRLNSGITAVRDLGDAYEFDGASGSTYFCPKHAERANILMSSILGQIKELAKAKNHTITVIPAAQARGQKGEHVLSPKK